jgi:hypothetical protein
MTHPSISTPSLRCWPGGVAAVGSTVEAEATPGAAPTNRTVLALSDAATQGDEAG